RRGARKRPAPPAAVRGCARADRGPPAADSAAEWRCDPANKCARGWGARMSEQELSFVHRFVPGEGVAAKVTLLLLHGTGGSEDDLLGLGRKVLPGAALLSPRGKVSEDGARRFFRRISEGVFDEEDLKRRATELAGFVREAIRAYQLDDDKLVAVGYSNGANIASGLMLLHPELLRAAALLRPMVPFEPDDPRPGRLKGRRVLLASGRH